MSDDAETRKWRRDVVAFFVRHRPWQRDVEPIWVYMQRPDDDNEMEWLRSLLSSPDNAGYKPNAQGRRLLHPIAPPPQLGSTRSTSIPQIPSDNSNHLAHSRTVTQGALNGLALEDVWQPLSQLQAPRPVTQQSAFQPRGVQFHPFIPPETPTRAPSPVFSEPDNSSERTLPDSVARWLGIEPAQQSIVPQNNGNNTRVTPHPTAIRMTHGPPQSTLSSVLPAHPSLPHRPPQSIPPVSARPPPTTRQFIPFAVLMSESRPAPPPPLPVTFHPFVPPQPQSTGLPHRQPPYAPPQSMQPFTAPPNVNTFAVPSSIGPPISKQGPYAPYRPTPSHTAHNSSMHASGSKQGPPAFQPNPELVPEYHAVPPTRHTRTRSQPRPSSGSGLQSFALQPLPPPTTPSGEICVYAYSSLNRKTRKAGARYSIWWGPGDARNRTARVEASCELDGALFAIALAVEDALPFALNSDKPVVVLSANVPAADSINTALASFTTQSRNIPAQVAHHIRILLAASSAHLTIRAHTGVSRRGITDEWYEARMLASEAAAPHEVGLPKVVLDERRRATVLRKVLGKNVADQTLARVEPPKIDQARPETEEEQLFELRMVSLAALLCQPLDELFSPVPRTELTTVLHALHALRSPTRLTLLATIMQGTSRSSLSDRLASQLSRARNILAEWNAEKNRWNEILPRAARKVAAASSSHQEDEQDEMKRGGLSHEEQSARRAYVQWRERVRQLNRFAWPEITVDGLSVTLGSYSGEKDEEIKLGKGKRVRTRRRKPTERLALMHFGERTQAQEKPNDGNGDEEGPAQVRFSTVDAAITFETTPEDTVRAQLEHAEVLLASWYALGESSRRSTEGLIRSLVERLLDDGMSTWRLDEDEEDKYHVEEGQTPPEGGVFADGIDDGMDTDESSTGFNLNSALVRLREAHALAPETGGHQSAIALHDISAEDTSEDVAELVTSTTLPLDRSDEAARATIAAPAKSNSMERARMDAVYRPPANAESRDSSGDNTRMDATLSPLAGIDVLLLPVFSPRSVNSSSLDVLASSTANLPSSSTSSESPVTQTSTSVNEPRAWSTLSKEIRPTIRIVPCKREHNFSQPGDQKRRRLSTVISRLRDVDNIVWDMDPMAMLSTLSYSELLDAIERLQILYDWSSVGPLRSNLISSSDASSSATIISAPFTTFETGAPAATSTQARSPDPSPTPHPELTVSPPTSPTASESVDDFFLQQIRDRLEFAEAVLDLLPENAEELDEDVWYVDMLANQYNVNAPTISHQKETKETSFAEKTEVQAPKDILPTIWTVPRKRKRKNDTLLPDGPNKYPRLWARSPRLRAFRFESPIAGDSTTLSTPTHLEATERPSTPPPGAEPSVASSTKSPPSSVVVLDGHISVNASDLPDEDETKVDADLALHATAMPDQEEVEQSSLTKQNQVMNRQVTTVTPHTRSAYYKLLIFVIALALALVAFLASTVALSQLSVYPLSM